VRLELWDYASRVIKMFVWYLNQLLSVIELFPEDGTFIIAFFCVTFVEEDVFEFVNLIKLTDKVR
jgi:hypothetical protein